MFEKCNQISSPKSARRTIGLLAARASFTDRLTKVPSATLISLSRARQSIQWTRDLSPAALRCSMCARADGAPAHARTRGTQHGIQATRRREGAIAARTAQIVVGGESDPGRARRPDHLCRISDRQGLVAMSFICGRETDRIGPGIRERCGEVGIGMGIPWRTGQSQPRPAVVLTMRRISPPDLRHCYKNFTQSIHIAGI